MATSPSTTPAAAGLDKAAAEFGVEKQESAATNGEAASAREERLNQLIEAGYTNIVAVGFAYADSVKKVAAANPDVKFAIVDDSSITADNVMNLTFAANQGSFLVGAAAALTSKTKHVGFVGGVETDLIKSFEAGFDAGVKAVDPSIKIDSKYLTQPPDFSGFGDVAKGKAAAEGMYRGWRRRGLPPLPAVPVVASSPRPRLRASGPSVSTPTRR